MFVITKESGARIQNEERKGKTISRFNRLESPAKTLKLVAAGFSLRKKLL